MKKLMESVTSSVLKNKPGASKVCAISKAQKAQNIFFAKNLKFSKIFSFGKCLIVPKNVKEETLLIYKHAFCCKTTKNSKGGPFEDIEIFRKKVAQCRKIKRGDPLVSAGFVGYVKKVKKMKGGTLWRQKKFRKKVASCRKKLKGGLSSPVRLCRLP